MNFFVNLGYCQRWKNLSKTAKMSHMPTEEKFWEGKKVIVTGAAGFVGSRLCKRLLSLGAFVTAIDRKKPDPAVYRLHDLELLEQNPNFIMENNDLLAPDALQALFNKYHCDSVFHLAASAIVSQAAHSPSPTISSNVTGTLNVLEAARQAGCRRVLVASSDKTYGDHATDKLEPLPYQERYSLKGLDIYSASKVCADTLAQAYAFQYKMPIAILRCCNIYWGYECYQADPQNYFKAAHK